MIRTAGLVLTLIVIAAGRSEAAAQQPEGRATIVGTVVEAATGEPLAATQVELVEAHRVETTRDDGGFVFPAVRVGEHTIAVQRIGYAPRSVEVVVRAGESTQLRIELEVAAVQFDEIVVTGTISERAGRDVLSPTTVVSGAELERKLGGTVAATLADEPGVAVTGLGPTTARPVIRGLSGDRIVMLEDGVRPGDMSATSGDHAVAMDPLTAQRFEVVRGPMSLLYGSSALGGVVNVVREEVPMTVPEHVHGTAVAQGESVSMGATAGGFAVMPIGSWAARVEGSVRSSGDVESPGGTLHNTDARTFGLAGGVGREIGRTHVGGSYRYFNSRYGIPGGFVGGHDAGVDVDMRRHAARGKIDVHGLGIFDEVQITGAFTDYRHSEIESDGHVGTQFSQDVTSLKVQGRHGSIGPLATGAIGVSAQYRDVHTAGSLRTPSTYDYAAAVFVVEELGTGPLRFQVGGRYDFAHYEPRDTAAFVFVGGEAIPVRPRDFGSFAGSLGVLYTITEPLRIGISAARAHRTPDFNELYTNGPHLAANSYDVGDPTLDTETGIGFDAFVRYHGYRLRGEVAVFRNQLDGYIFPSSRGRIELGTQGGRPRFQYTNEDARFVGVEGTAEWSVTERIIMEATGSLVSAEFTGRRAAIPVLEDGDTILVPASKYPPLIPPPNGRVAVRYETADWFAGAGARLAAEQDRTGDFETPTSAYALADLIGGVRFLGGGRLHTLTLRIDNLLDASYRDHLSRIKDIMPEPGRNISLLYRLTF